jgi:hypothetical protein
MYARVNIVFGERGKIDAGIDRLEGSDRPVVESTSGNRGLVTLVDRDAGVIVATSYWDEALYSSEAALTEAREAVAAAAGGDLVVERFELAGHRLSSVPMPGAAVVMARVQLDPGAVADGLTAVRDEMLPPIAAVDGFCSAEILIDHDSGAGIVVTAWANATAADQADRVLEPLREDAEHRCGVKFTRAETYALVRTTARLD